MVQYSLHEGYIPWMGPDIERLRLTAGGIRPSPTQTKCHDRSVSTVGQTPGDTIKCSSNYFFFYYIHVLHFLTMEHKLIKKWIVGVLSILHYIQYMNVYYLGENVCYSSSLILSNNICTKVYYTRMTYMYIQKAFYFSFCKLICIIIKFIIYYQDDFRIGNYVNFQYIYQVSK